MLHNPKWDAPPKVDPLTLTALIAWLEQQPAKRSYCYINELGCLAYQYNKSIGRKYVTRETREPKRFDYTLENIASVEPYTFGAALERARKLAAKQRQLVDHR